MLWYCPSGMNIGGNDMALPVRAEYQTPIMGASLHTRSQRTSYGLPLPAAVSRDRQLDAADRTMCDDFAGDIDLE